jgi:hypothetical protein
MLAEDTPQLWKKVVFYWKINNSYFNSITKVKTNQQSISFHHNTKSSEPRGNAATKTTSSQQRTASQGHRPSPDHSNVT